MRRLSLLLLFAIVLSSSPAFAKKKREERAHKMLVGGIVITSFGMATLLAGVITIGLGAADEAEAQSVYEAYGCEQGECPAEAQADLEGLAAGDKTAPGVELLVTAASSLGVGIAFWVVGAHLSEEHAGLRLQLQPGGAALRFSW